MPGQTDPEAEKELQKLRKLDSNKKCPNCGKDGGLAGHNAVCVPFKTFICTDCKSAHQSFSHRCKSCTESFWTKEDVKALKEKNGGGNSVAMRTWLGRVTDSDRLKEGDDLNKKKRFIEKAYEEKKFWVDGGGVATSGGEDSSKKEKKSKKDKKADVAEEEALESSHKKDKKEKKEKKSKKGDPDADAYGYEADAQYYGYYGGAGYPDPAQQYYQDPNQQYYQGQGGDAYYAGQYGAEYANGWQQEQDGSVDAKAKKEKKSKKEKKGEVAMEEVQMELPSPEKKEKKEKKSKKGDAAGAAEAYDQYNYEGYGADAQAAWGQDYASGQQWDAYGYGGPDSFGYPAAQMAAWSGTDAAGYYSADPNSNWAPGASAEAAPVPPSAAAPPQDPAAWNGTFGQEQYDSQAWQQWQQGQGACGAMAASNAPAYPGAPQDGFEQVPAQSQGQPAQPALPSPCSGSASPTGQPVAAPVLAAAAAALASAKKPQEVAKPAAANPVMAMLQAQLELQQARATQSAPASASGGLDPSVVAGLAMLGSAPATAPCPAAAVRASSPSLSSAALVSLALSRNAAFKSSPGAPAAVPGPYSPLSRSPVLGVRSLVNTAPGAPDRRPQPAKKTSNALQPRGWALSVPVLPTNPWAAEVAADSTRTKLQPTNPWASDVAGRSSPGIACR